MGEKPGNAGWPFEEFRRTTGFDLRDGWAAEMKQLVERGWGEMLPESFHLTRQGLRFADSAAERFLRLRSGASADRRQFQTKSNRKILTGLAAFSRKPLRNKTENRETVDGLPALPFAQPQHRQRTGKDGNDSASDVRQRCDVRVKCRGKQRTENAGQTSRALRHADGRALFVRGREVGQQSEKRRARHGGTHRQQRQRQQQFDPRPVGRVQDGQPLSCPSPLMNGSRIRLMPFRNRLSEINLGSPNILTSGPMARPG